MEITQKEGTDINCAHLSCEVDTPTYQDTDFVLKYGLGLMFPGNLAASLLHNLDRTQLWFQ